MVDRIVGGPVTDNAAQDCTDAGNGGDRPAETLELRKELRQSTGSGSRYQGGWRSNFRWRGVGHLGAKPRLMRVWALLSYGRLLSTLKLAAHRLRSGGSWRQPKRRNEGARSLLGLCRVTAMWKILRSSLLGR